MSHMLQPSIILLREGTDTSQGKGQIISNVNACMAIVDTVRTTLGPRGMDKLMYQEGGAVTISNDGATIMKLLDIVHPAAQTLVEIAKSQDSEVGDGTTSVVLLAGELLKEGKPYIEEGMHSQVLIRGYRRACEMVREKLKELCVTVDPSKKEELRAMLLKCAGTSMNSKLIRPYKEFFSRMVVDAIETLDDELALESIGIKKESGGSMQDSLFIKGVAFKKTFSYAGFEQQPKKFTAPKVLLLNVELELKAEKDNAEVRIHSVDKYQEMVDAEWKILFDKLDLIAKTGAKVVLSRLAIGDLATQFFADHDIFCAGRVPQDDLARVAKATGGQVQTSVTDLIPTVLGTCGVFEERQVGAERYNFFTECPQSKTATIILRGGGEHFNDEAERSIHDAIMVVRRARKHLSVVAGGGAIEMELSAWLRRESAQVDGKQALIVKSFAKALEVIPRQLAINAGFDSTDIMNKLRQKHHTPGAGKWFGVDINSGDVCDTWEAAVWEPTLVKLNSITAATEAACTIFSVDETVRNPKSEAPDTGAIPASAMRGRGGMRGMRGRGGRRF